MSNSQFIPPNVPSVPSGTFPPQPEGPRPYAAKYQAWQPPNQQQPWAYPAQQTPRKPKLDGFAIMAVVVAALLGVFNLVISYLAQRAALDWTQIELINLYVLIQVAVDALLAGLALGFAIRPIKDSLAARPNSNPWNLLLGLVGGLAALAFAGITIVIDVIALTTV